ASLGAAAWIPVDGWILAIAATVALASGGKLFGTKGKLHHSNTALEIMDGGFDLSQSYTLKGERSLFRGTRWTTKDIDPSPEAMAAAQAFYDAILKHRDDFAKAFNAETGAMVGGIF